MKISKIIFAFLLFILLVNTNIFCQNYNIIKSNIKSFINYKGLRFDHDTIIKPFNSTNNFLGLTISGQLEVNDINSLVRVILIDSSGNEYLVYEMYSEISDSLSKNIFNEGLETTILNKKISAKELQIYLRNSSIEITNIQIYDIKDNSESQTLILKDEMKRNHEEKIIKALTGYINKNGMVWKAGETFLSKLDFQKKQDILGKGFYTHGYEYYVGGFFEFKKYTENSLINNFRNQEETKITQNISSSNELTRLYSSEGLTYNFDWRKRHDADNPNSKYYDGDISGSGWMTSVKCQGGCWINNKIECWDTIACNNAGGEFRGVGTCWAFASIGSLEALINLYFNNHIDYDLSEQEIVSCSWENGAIPGYVHLALLYLKNTGVVLENCFPYQAANGDCENDICSIPNERIRISDYFGAYSSVSSIKSNLMHYGPLPCKMDDWAHAVVCVGWDVIKEGDYIDFTGGVVVPPGSPYIGQEYWILKNSSVGWAWPYHPGYIYMINPPDWAYSIETPLTSLVYDENDVRCIDLDGDGYYNWGIGSKPDHCPPCPELFDGNDNNPYLGPQDADGSVSVNLPYSFGFENGLGVWHQSKNDNIEWTRFSGSTPSPLTGPISAYEGSYYMYVEASSPNYPNKSAILVSPSFNLATGCNASITFNYHMYGSAMGSLELQISIDGGINWDTGIWTVSGDQGNIWRAASISLSGYTGNLVKFRLVAITGSGDASDIAIDNISVIENLSGTESITNTQIWSDFRQICGNISIQNGGILTITGNVTMPFSGIITVQNGSELIIDGGKLVNANITVQNGGKVTLRNNGTIVLNNDAVTVNAGGLFDYNYGEIQVIN